MIQWFRLSIIHFAVCILWCVCVRLYYDFIVVINMIVGCGYCLALFTIFQFIQQICTRSNRSEKLALLTSNHKIIFFVLVDGGGYAVSAFFRQIISMKIAINFIFFFRDLCVQFIGCAWKSHRQWQSIWLGFKWTSVETLWTEFLYTCAARYQSVIINVKFKSAEKSFVMSCSLWLCLCSSFLPPVFLSFLKFQFKWRQNNDKNLLCVILYLLNGCCWFCFSKHFLFKCLLQRQRWIEEEEDEIVRNENCNGEDDFFFFEYYKKWAGNKINNNNNTFVRP